MSKKKILIVIALLIAIIGLTILTIGLLNKEKSITCSGTENKNGTDQTITIKYNYDNKGQVIKSIDYTIELNGTMDDEQLAASKIMFENTICSPTKPANVTCDIKVAKNNIKVITHEEIKENKSTLLGLEDLDKLTYEVNKENNKDNKECKFN